MSVLLRHKRSAVSGAQPSTNDIAYGELTVNTFDGKVHFKKNDGNGDQIVTLQEVTEYNLGVTTTEFYTSNSNNLHWVLRDLDSAINNTATNLGELNTNMFAVGADDSTLVDVGRGESIRFLGAQGISTSSDDEGNITITGPDLSSYLTAETDTLATVTGRGASTTTNVEFNGTGNSVQVGDTLRIAQTGSGMRMTNVGAFDNDGSNNFRIFATNNLQLKANGDTGSGIDIATSGAITFNGEYTFPTTDGDNGQVLVTNGSGTLTWATLSGSGAALTTINSIPDVDTNGANDGDILVYDGTNWVAQAPADDDHVVWNLMLG
jgi:hypothetical protein